MTASPEMRRLGDQLHLVTLPLPLPGFAKFITAWVYTGGPVLLIDVGPSSSTAHLLKALEQIGLRRLDYILLTHIHLDHSGAIGQIARRFPHAPVVCHPKAADHLIDPQRLWEGSLQTLGEVALRYGRIEPVDKAQILTADLMKEQRVQALPTPGHAPHHYSYLVGEVLFAGEAGGVCLDAGAKGFYMRPATPPRFILEISLESIDRLIALKPRVICYGHVGAQGRAVEMLQTHRSQLRRWLDLIQPWYDSAPAGGEETLDACLAHLLKSDPLLASFDLLPADVQSRERFFLLNSLRGYWGYLRDKQS